MNFFVQIFFLSSCHLNQQKFPTFLTFAISFICHIVWKNYRKIRKICYIIRIKIFNLKKIIENNNTNQSSKYFFLFPIINPNHNEQIEELETEREKDNFQKVL